LITLLAASALVAGIAIGSACAQPAAGSELLSVSATSARSSP
jgi:hypothetical protein